MISGILLLPLKMDTFDFLKPRLKKVVGPLLFWTFLYVSLCYIDSEQSSFAFVKRVCSIPFSNQESVLWFIYPLIGIYFLAPILSRFIVNAAKKEIEFYLILWGVTLVYPLIKPFLFIDDGQNGILYYFMGYNGFFILGYYLHHFRVTVKKLYYPVLIFFPILVYGFYKAMGWIDSLFEWNFYLNIWVAIYSVGWFLYILSLCEPNYPTLPPSKKHTPKKHTLASKLLIEVSNCSFGIYLIHIFVIRKILSEFEMIICSFGEIGKIVVTWQLTMFFSFILTYFISYLPFSNYIIGYSHIKRPS